MKKLLNPHILITLLLLILLLLPARLSAQTPPDVLLVETQTGNADSATNEFVELFNLSYQAVNIDGWQLQYMPSSASNWYTKAELSGHIAPRGRVLVANYEAAEEYLEMSGGFASSGGHVRIVNADETELDRLGWGTALEPLGSAAETHQAGESLKRQTDEDGNFIDTQDNGSDWFVSMQPSPQHISWQPPVEEEADTTNQDPDETQTQKETNANDSSGSSAPRNEQSAGQTPAQDTSKNIVPEFPVHITEVFPDPGSPLSDSEDEFIELYNPNDFPVDLTGYQIESGKSFHSTQMLQSVTMQPHQYLAFYSSDIELSLSNSGAVVRLVGSRGTELSFIQTPKAKTDMAWAQVGQTWQWLNPSPGKENTLSQDGAAETQVASATVNTGNTATETAGFDSDVNQDERAQYQPAEEQTVEPINLSILAGVGGLAVLYALYEYRHDIGNRIQQLRRYVTNRRKNRPKASRRGVSGA